MTVSLKLRGYLWLLGVLQIGAITAGQCDLHSVLLPLGTTGITSQLGQGSQKLKESVIKDKNTLTSPFSATYSVMNQACAVDVAG